jgi:AcrR family transcriptional regulator
MNDSSNKSKPRIVARWEEGRPSATEARLLAGTLDCLRRLGLRRTTSRAIASASGVNLGAITYHFGSKDELVAQALLQAIRSWVAPALEVLEQEMDPAARMVAAIDHLRASFEGAREMLPVYLEALVAAPRHDTLRRGVSDLMGAVRRLLAAQTAELRDAGYLPAWVEPDAMATLLVATADGLGLHGVLEPDAIDAARVAAQAVQLLLAARGPQPFDASVGAPPP